MVYDGKIKMNIAIITARGGSKRIPKKNIKSFCGKPIIAYSIKAALDSGLFDKVMISTDSEEIAEIAKQYGASVPFLRSKETSTDYATTADVILEVLTKIEAHFDCFTCIYPTAPFITPQKLIAAMKVFTEAKADSCVSVVKYSFPPQRGFQIRQGYIRYQYPEFERIRSQDIEPIYHDCGQFYICSTDEFLKRHTLILPKTVPYIIEEEEVQDIDTISDWDIAEMKYSIMHRGKNMIRTCKECGFILGTRPRAKEEDGVCLACANKHRKEKIDWASRQKWLTNYLEEHRNPEAPYDVVVGVSGGKDSCSIVRRLIENHHVPHNRLLLVHVCDEFTPSDAGRHNLDNLVKVYDLDLINFRCGPKTFVTETKKSFFEKLHPLEWIENQIYKKPLEFAKAFKIPTVFMGENSAFEYGESEECEIFHPASDDETKVIFMGAIYPYSNIDSLAVSKEIGFKTLDDFDDWQRQGSADSFTQIDSKGYMIQIWTKFVKFGFQRVSDMACRFVREGILTKEQAEEKIRDFDWICDPLAKKDFCRTIGITEKEFDDTVDKFANKDHLVKDANGHWRRKDLFSVTPPPRFRKISTRHCVASNYMEAA